MDRTILGLVMLVLTVVVTVLSASAADYEFDGKWGGFGASFNGPWDVAVDAAGNVYVTDLLNHRIQKLGSDGSFTQWGSLGSGDGEFNNPWGLSIDDISFDLFMQKKYGLKCGSLECDDKARQLFWEIIITNPWFYIMTLIKRLHSIILPGLPWFPYNESQATFSFSEKIKNLLHEMETDGGITVYCPKCTSAYFIEPDAHGWCDPCDTEIENPLMSAGMI